MKESSSIALVTGVSRDKGIGAAICRILARDGMDIFFTHWGTYDGEDGCSKEEGFPSVLAKELEGLGVRTAHMEADLSRQDAPALILQTATQSLGLPRVLINNATYESPTDFRTMRMETLDMHYQVNNRGTIMLSVEFARRFEEVYAGAEDGRIVFMVSKGPDPHNLAYTATKGMLTAITEPLATALAPVGITVNSVDPGPTDSGWITDEIRENLLPLFPSGRIGTPEDAARLIRFLASEDSRWVTGQVLRSEGGFLGK
ncbi:SDR family oxidoreductase [Rossellomorea marisflavi]|uniref:SDR family oxidoreductase n=1 Tax=Rossellomorea marisflavi TaxID=189381 RepID=UPI00064E3BC3|nr:SDR family oxidoreductase [Rossellomorea marisflavi]KMK91362.1 oxidoreductase [Rossellomorea marisflavi]